MSGPRLREDHRLALKSATRVVLGAHGKGSAAAAACRLNESSLSDCASGADAHAERFLPVDVALQLELTGQSRALTAALAHAHGCALVPVAPRDAARLRADLERLAAEIGDTIAAQARAWSDGTLSDAERAELARELGELAEAARHAQASLLGPNLKLRGGK